MSKVKRTDVYVRYEKDPAFFDLQKLQGKSVRFAVTGTLNHFKDDELDTGKGRVEEVVSARRLVVRLSTDDLGGYGTYRRGNLVNIDPSELIL